MIITKRKILLSIMTFIAFVLFFIVVSWVFSNGSLNITMPSGTKKIIIKSDEFEKIINTDATTYSTRLKSTSYSVTVLTEDKSYLQSVNVPNFLRTATVDAELTAQHDREFIGDNPRSCMHNMESSGLLISYTCGGSLFGLRVHKPASEDTPTTTQSMRDVFKRNTLANNLADPGNIEGVVDIEGKTKVLIRASNALGGGHLLYGLAFENNLLKINNIEKVANLSDEFYSMYKRGDDIVLISVNNNRVLTTKDFIDFQSTTIESIDKKNVSDASGFDSLGEKHVFAFQKSKSNRGQVVAIESADVYFRENDKLKKSNISKVISEMSFCGNYICILGSDEKLEILTYDLKVVHVFYEVKDFVIFNSDILIKDENGIAKIGLEDSIAGYYITFNSYDVQSIYVSDESVLIGVRGKNKSHAMIVSNEPSNKSSDDFIDIAVKELSNSTFVNSLSLHKNVIYISAELGERVFSETTQTFRKNPETVKQARNAINEAIENSKLNELGYTIITPGL